MSLPQKEADLASVSCLKDPKPTPLADLDAAERAAADFLTALGIDLDRVPVSPGP